MATAQLEVQPKKSFLDEQIRITANGLDPYGRYTITAFCRLENRHPGFWSHGHYVANSDGVIDVTTMASYGGSYVGVEPMGLIWSMKKLIEANEVELVSLRNPVESFDILYSLRIGHISPPFDKNADDLSPITQYVAKRLAVAPHVKRIPIREGRIRGTLFVPQGPGPFKGILDIDGIDPYGTVYERTASLLASRGYLSLALAYQDYDDLPDKQNLELEYFIEAVEWLESHPLAAKTGITVSGECFGGIVALYLAIACGKVKAVITRNTYSYVLFGTLRYKSQPLPKYIHHSNYADEIARNGKDVVGRVIYPPVVDWVLPIEKVSRDVRFLFIVGEDDYAAHPRHTELLIDRLKKGRHNNYKLVSYPGTGHLITLSYSPYIFSGENAWVAILLGGEMYAHVKAQEKAWHEVLKFMEHNSVLAKL